MNQSQDSGVAGDLASNNAGVTANAGINVQVDSVDVGDLSHGSVGTRLNLKWLVPLQVAKIASLAASNGSQAKTGGGTDSLAGILADGQGLAAELPASTLGKLDVVVGDGHGRADNGNDSKDLRELHLEEWVVDLDGVLRIESV